MSVADSVADSEGLSLIFLRDVDVLNWLNGNYWFIVAVSLQNFETFSLPEMKPPYIGKMWAVETKKTHMNSKRGWLHVRRVSKMNSEK